MSYSILPVGVSIPCVRTVSIFALSVFFTSYTQARTINVDETISSGDPVENFVIGSGATVTVNNASTLNVSSNGSQFVVNTGTTQDIAANNGSTVTLNNANVVARANQPGVRITNSNATITDSTIISNVTGLQVARVVNAPLATTVSLIGTTVTGGETGAVVSAQTVLNMHDSQLVGSSLSGNGLRLAGGDVFARGGSLVGGQNGVLLSGDNFLSRANSLVLDGVRVKGVNGAAIAVDSAGRPVVTEVHLINSANLVGGNGNLLEVNNGGTVNLTVDNVASLTGNIKVATGAISNVVLQNHSLLTGNLHNVASVSLNNQSVLKGDVVNDSTNPSSVLLDNGSSLEGQIVNSSRVTINNQAQWKVTGDNEVNALALNGGTVKFHGAPTYSRLNVVNLSGEGTFGLDANLASGTSDFLNVTGTASGKHQLLVTPTGNEPTSGNPVKVGNIAAGNADFSLFGRAIDAGAFTYKLLKDGEGLYLVPDKETVSTGTNAALAIAGTAPTVLYAEMTTLNTRLGDRRLNGAEPSARTRSTDQSQAGVWIRTYGNQYRVANAYGEGYSQNQNGVSLGGDKQLLMGDGQWLVGGFGGYSKTDLDLKLGSTATIDSVYLGGYLTWYDADSGYYVDTVAKLNQFENHAKVRMSDGTLTKSDYKNLGLSGSVEIGKHIALDGAFFVAPYAQLNAAVVQGKDYTLDNGLRVSNDNTRSLLGEVGATVGREIVLGNGSKLQPRIKAAVAHEFVKNNVVSVNDNDFNNNLATTSVKLSGGINWAPTRKSWQVYAEVGTSQGKTIDQDWSASAGLSYNF